MSVELFVNGDSKGVKKNNEDVYRFIWDDITYQPGSIKAVGYDSEGKSFVKKKFLQLMFLKNFLCLPIEKRLTLMVMIYHL